MGIRLSVLEFAKIAGVSTIVISYISTALFFTNFIAKKLKLSSVMEILIGVGTSIYGATAIVATNSAIDAKEEEVTYAVATITIFGIIAMFSYPYLAHFIFDQNFMQSGCLWARLFTKQRRLQEPD